MSSIQTFRNQVEELIKAKTPLFYLGSMETSQTTKDLRTIASDLETEVRIFDFSTGILEGNGEKTNTDPIGVLDIILKRMKTPSSERPILWVLPFFHLLLQASDPIIVGKLRNIVEFSRFDASVIIIGVPGFALPPELHDIPMIDTPFPDSVYIESQLDSSLSNEEKLRISRLCVGLQLREIEDLFSRSFVRQGRIDPETIKDLKRDLLRKRGGNLIDIQFPHEDLTQVGGMRDLKEWLHWRKEAFLNPGLLQKWNLPAPKGILLTGVPGCGKSLLGRAIAGSWKLPLVRFDPSRSYSASLGATERSIIQCLDLTRVASPCVLWIDEIEKCFSLADPRTDGGVSGRLLGIFLNFLQERDFPVFIVATSNDLSSMPPEMLRKGRWDEIFFIDLPERDERLAIFELLFVKHGIMTRIDEDLLSLSEGFSGAEIEQAVLDALYKVISRKPFLDPFEIKIELKKAIPLSISMKEKIDRLRKWAVGRAKPANGEQTTYTTNKRIIPLQRNEA
jgi:hypothetical protein